MQNAISFINVIIKTKIVGLKIFVPVKEQKWIIPKMYITNTPKIPKRIFLKLPLILSDAPQRIVNGKKPIMNPPAGSEIWWKPPQKPEKIGAPSMPKRMYVKTARQEFLAPRVYPQRAIEKVCNVIGKNGVGI